MNSEQMPLELLIVESDSPTAHSRIQDLADHAFSCVTASSIEEASRYLLDHPELDLVIVDQTLLCNLDRAEHATWISNLASIPVIVLNEDSETCIEGTFTDPPYYGFCLKHDPPQALRGAIQIALRLHTAEHAIEASNAHILSLFTAAPVGLGVIRDRVIIECNERVARMFGYTKEEIVGLETSFLYATADEADKSGKELREQLQSEGVGEIETRFRTKDGEIRDVLACIAPIGPLIQGDPDSIHSQLLSFTIQDITERKIGERALAARVAALTSPLGTVDQKLTFEELFDLEEIQVIQDAFADATQVASIITDENGAPITRPSNFTRLCYGIIRNTKMGCENCIKSDKALGSLHTSGPLVSPCLSGGLWDGGASITVGNRHIGNWLIGQVLDENADKEKLRAYAKVIGVDQATYDAALDEVPRMSKEQFAKVAKALFLIARQLSNLAYSNIQQARAIVERHKAENEKDALYRELKHRIKNGMTMMASLVDLESYRHESPETRAALEATRARIESLATLYTLLGGSSDPTELRVDEYLGSIVKVVENTFAGIAGHIQFTLDLQPVVIAPSAAAPLGLILMELLTNALKYAFPNKKQGEVRVRLKLTGDSRMLLAVEDNGVGLPKGFSPEHSTGLGMELVRMLVIQLGAQFSFRNEAGACFQIDLEGYSIRPA